MKKLFIVIVIFTLFLGGPLYMLFSGQLVLGKHWREADRSSSKIAPNPNSIKESIVQIYAARAFNWRGMFGLHTWLVIKQKNENKYSVYQIIGWKLLQGLEVIDVRYDIPDRMWFGNKPWILYQAIGEEADLLIPQINKLIKQYPFKNKYSLWPGPNSNTFIAYIIRNIPSIKIRLPVTAIGKDYQINSICTKALSKTGIQCSLKGIISLTLAKVEGIEINLFGFTFAFNTEIPYVHLPGID